MDEKSLERADKWAAWRESDDAKLFESFQSSWGNVNAADATWHGSDAGLRKRWEAAEKKRWAFLERFCELAGLKNPYEI